MTEEHRLMAIGWPYSEAVNVCHTMRKDRKDLAAFVREEEQKARNPWWASER